MKFRVKLVHESSAVVHDLSAVRHQLFSPIRFFRMISEKKSCKIRSESNPKTGGPKGAHLWELQGQNSKAGTALDKILFRYWYLCWNLTRFRS
jgi:hypothetical protein